MFHKGDVSAATVSFRQMCSKRTRLNLTSPKQVADEGPIHLYRGSRFIVTRNGTGLEFSRSTKGGRTLHPRGHMDEIRSAPEVMKLDHGRVVSLLSGVWRRGSKLETWCPLKEVPKGLLGTAVAAHLKTILLTAHICVWAVSRLYTDVGLQLGVSSSCT